VSTALNFLGASLDFAGEGVWMRREGSRRAWRHESDLEGDDVLTRVLLLALVLASNRVGG